MERNFWPTLYFVAACSVPRKQYYNLKETNTDEKYWRGTWSTSNDAAINTIFYIPTLCTVISSFLHHGVKEAQGVKQLWVRSLLIGFVIKRVHGFGGFGLVGPNDWIELSHDYAKGYYFIQTKMEKVNICYFFLFDEKMFVGMCTEFSIFASLTVYTWYIYTHIHTCFK